MKRLVTVLAILLAASAAAAAQGEQPDPRAADGVRFAAVPAYLPIWVERPDGDRVVAGEVTVDVVANSEGAVGEATIVGAPDVLFIGGWARKAALEWKFEATPGSWSRSYRLTFSFDGEKLSDAPEGVQSVYESPLTLHLVYNRPSIRHLDRSSWGPEPPRCPVHGIPMVVELLPIHYGMPRGSSPSDPDYDILLKYGRARMRRFPNARDFVGGPCTPSSETVAEVLVCPACREAKRAWLRAHPDLPARYR